MTTKRQQASIDQIVASIERTGHAYTIAPQGDGTVRVQRIGSDTFAIIGRGGAVKWGGRGGRYTGVRASI